MYQRPQSYETDRIYCHFGTFFALLPHPCPPLTTQKIKILTKWSYHLEVSSFYTSVPKMMIIWRMLSEIWSVTGIFFLSFWFGFCPFTPLGKCKKKPWRYYPFTHLHHIINEDHMMCDDSWDIRHDMQNSFVILGHFLPFDPPNNLKKKNLSLISCIILRKLRPGQKKMVFSFKKNCAGHVH